MTSSFIGSALRSLEPKSLHHALRARSGTRLSPAHIEPLARPDGAETERRLEWELSQILSRPPVKRQHGLPAHLGPLSEIEPDEPQPTLLFIGPHFHGQATTQQAVYPPDSRYADTGDATRTGHDNDYSNRSLDGPEIGTHNTNWLKTARRARRNRTLRLAASWVITILVGGFIILMAAAILFGLPDGRFALREGAVLAATHEYESVPGNPGLLRTRWRLD